MEFFPRKNKKSNGKDPAARAASCSRKCAMDMELTMEQVKGCIEEHRADVSEVLEALKEKLKLPAIVDICAGFLYVKCTRCSVQHHPEAFEMGDGILVCIFCRW